MKDNLEIPGRKTRIELLTGIYFLFNNKNLIYIGQSTNIIYRVGTHLKDKEFNRYAYILCSKERLLDLERQYLNKYNPSLNKSTGSDYSSDPLC